MKIQAKQSQNIKSKINIEDTLSPFEKNLQEKYTTKLSSSISNSQTNILRKSNNNKKTHKPEISSKAENIEKKENTEKVKVRLGKTESCISDASRNSCKINKKNSARKSEMPV